MTSNLKSAASSACTRCGNGFAILPEDIEFYNAISPSFQGNREIIPPPTLCPDCRLQRRFAFRNERHLYKRKSCFSNAEFISILSPESPYKTCSYEEWWSDAWDAMSFGRGFDPARPFTDQLLELSLDVPHCPLYIRNGQNSDYTNYSLNIKDCYLIFGSTDCDHCLYSKSLAFDRDVVDCLAVVKSELCYEGIASDSCYQCSFFSHCVSCTDCFMVEACESCSHCAMCFGLYRKEYCIGNEFVGKARYEQFMQSLRPLTLAKIQDCRNKFLQLKSTLPHRQSYDLQSENCVGDNISHSKNCFWCFDVNHCEDSKYLFWTPKGIRSYDCSYNAPDGVELCYEACSTLGSRCMGTFMCWNNDSAYYCIESHYNRDVFGCVGLQHKQYCVLNKQYTKEQYETLVTEIIAQMRSRGEWGQYLPEKLSLFGYNETIGNEYFPRSEKEATSLGFRWRDDPENGISSDMPSTPPESIEATDNSILTKTLVCESSGRKYRVVPTELEFYRKLGIPVPKYSPDERHARRLARRNPLTLWTRKCAKTGVDIWTNFAPDDPALVYSNEAYRQYMYS